jgi:signal transduction histidine kinase
LFEAEHTAREQAETLRQTTAALTSTLDLGQVLNSLLTYLGQVIPYDSSAVFLQEKDGLRAMAVRGLPYPDQVLGHRFSLDNEIFAQLYRTQQPIVLDDAGTDPRFEGWGGTGDIRGWMGVPLISRGECIGLMTLDSRQAATYTEAEAGVAQAFANAATAAINNAQLFDEVSTGREKLQALSRRLVEVQEAERGHISRELHDETGQTLSSLLLGLSLLEREAHQPEAVITRALELEEMVDELLENLHRLAMNLRPASLDHLGLIPALEHYTEVFGRQHNLIVQFEAVGLAGERLSPTIETTLYRIVQEALTNVSRHAHASQVDVVLERRGGQVVTIVEDDGVGFDPETALKSGRLGLFGIQERAEMLGGTLTIESSSGAGTTIFVEVPYAHPNSHR